MKDDVVNSNEAQIYKSGYDEVKPEKEQANKSQADTSHAKNFRMYCSRGLGYQRVN